MKHLVTIFVGAALLAGMAGCVQPKNPLTAPTPVDQVDQITLFTLPTAINWDSKPGADGVQVNVYLFQVAQSPPVLITGTLEFLLYEGRVAPGEVSAVQPFHVWRFPAREIEPYRGRSKIGWGYALKLPWGPRTPQSASISLVARYISPTGAEVCSEPVTIAMKRD